jgi:hypothetical protein
MFKKTRADREVPPKITQEWSDARGERQNHTLIQFLYEKFFFFRAEY